MTDPSPLLGLLAYLGPGALATYWWGAQDPFLRFHARQGLGLLLVEGAWLSVWIFLGQTLGRIPFLGILIMVLVGLAAIGTTITWSAIGVVRVLAREKSELPILGGLIDRWWD